METILRTICQAEGLAGQEIHPLAGGQVNRVFLVDGRYVLRIGARQDAFDRLQRETGLLQRLAGQVPVPRVLAFGQQDELVYQIQELMPGQKLFEVWRGLSSAAQESIVADLAAFLQALHRQEALYFGYPAPESLRYDTWASFLSDKFERTLAEIQTLGLRADPGIVSLASEFFTENRHVLEGGRPALVHGDLILANILVDQGRVSAILDFEYALYAPADYELLDLEAFCLYPNDYAGDEQQIYCAADFARFFQLLQKHAAALFNTPQVRRRLDLYHVEATLSSWLGWRKANLEAIPADSPAGMDYAAARLTNFIFHHGARMFHG